MIVLIVLICTRGLGGGRLLVRIVLIDIIGQNPTSDAMENRGARGWQVSLFH